MGVRVVVVEVVRHRVNDRGRHLGAAGTIEIRHGVATVLAFQGWKSGADVGGRVGHLGPRQGGDSVISYLSFNMTTNEDLLG